MFITEKFVDNFLTTYFTKTVPSFNGFSVLVYYFYVRFLQFLAFKQNILLFLIQDFKNMVYRFVGY